MNVQNFTNSKLVAESTTRSGNVRCEAVNKEGEDQKSLDITIKGPGTPPLKILPSTAGDGFKVEWTQPQIPNGDITVILRGGRNLKIKFSRWLET